MGTERREHLEEAGRFTSFSLIGEIARYLLLIASSALVTNTFGAAVFGRYSYIISFLTILITLSGLGMRNASAFFLPKFGVTGSRSKQRATVSLAYVVVAVCGSLITALVMVFSRQIAAVMLNSAEDGRLLLTMAPLILIEALYGQALSVFSGMKRIARRSLIRNIIYHVLRISAILLCFIVFGFRNVYGIVIPTYFAYIAGLLYSLYSQYRKNEIGTTAALGKQEKKQVILYALPLFMSAIIHVLLRQADILMLGYIIDNEAVAVYKVAVQICAFIPFVRHISSSFFGPMISSLYHSGKKEELTHLYKTVSKWIFTFGLMVFLGILLFSKSVLHLFGSDFIGGSTALILVACGSLVGVVAGSAGSMNSMTGHPRFSLLVSSVVFVVNICLNIIMIPRYGINGAAIATLISAFIGSVMSFTFLLVKQGIHPYNLKFLKPLAAGGVSFAVISLTRRYIMWQGITDVLIKGALFVLLFAGVLFALRFDDDDRTIFKGMMNSISRIVRKKNK